MARIRTIKPEFWTDEKVVELSAFARLLFIGLWNFCDDDGRLVYSPKRLKMQIFPSDPVDCTELVTEIQGAGLVTVYVVNAVEYLQVDGFSKHQKIDKRSPSKHPAPPNSCCSPQFTPISPKSPQIPPTCPDGMEGKGKDQGMVKEPPLSPEGETGSVSKKSNAMSLQTFLAVCKEKGERPLRDYAPLWDWAKGAGLDADLVALAWFEFCRQMLPGGVSESKRQADWRKTFRNYVEKNYLKLWAIDPRGQYFLSSQGKQAEKLYESKATA